MEKVAMVAENGQCIGSNHLPKFVDSSLKIDSITIDLVNANEKGRAEKCDHFSMRKYVSDVRKKNWKLCWPFASDGGGNKYDEREGELPPIHIPDFRYWRCQSCLRDIRVQDFETDRVIAHGTSTSGFKSGTIFSHASILQDDAVLVTDLQHLPDINFHKGKKIDANALTNTNNTSRYHPSSQSGKNKDDKEVTDFLTLARNLVSDDYSNKEEHQLTTGLSSLIQTTYPVNGKVNHKSKGKGSIDLCKTTFGQSEVANTELGGDHSRVLKKAAINIKGKEVCASNPQKELVACDTSGEHSNSTNKAHKTSKGNVLQSPKMDEYNNASSESTEVMPGKNICHGSSSGLHRRKIRKVRLLSDLLSEKGNGNRNNIKVDDSRLNGISDADGAGGKPLDPPGQVIIHGNGRRVLAQHRKRKLDEDGDEDWSPVEIESPSKASKEVRILKRDANSTERIAKAFSKMQLQSARKNNCPKLQSDGNPVLSKKKCKKAIIFEDLVTVPNELMGAGVKAGDASTSNGVHEVLPNPITKADKDREVDFFPLSSQRTDRKPNVTKKSKILHADYEQASPIPWNHMLEDLSARKGAGFLHTQPAEIPFHLARDASSEKGQNLSLNSYLTMPRFDMQHNPLVGDIDTSLLSWQKRAVREDQASNRVAGTNSVRNFTLASDMSAGKGIHSEMSTKGITNNMPLIENQNYSSQPETGSCSHMQQKNFGGVNSNKKAIEIRELPTVKRNNHDQRANRAPEQGNLDDIPMEIVELMAKHQYERRLPDAENDRCQTINFNKAFGNREVGLFQPGTAQKQNPRATINRNGITIRGENLDPFKQKADYFSQANGNQFTMSQIHQTPVPAGFEALFQHQEKPSSRIQHSGSSSGRQNIAQNSKWNEDSVGKRSCNSCMTIQQNRNTNHIWSSLMPNHIPFLYTAPQKCNPLPSNVDVLPNSSIGVHKENVGGDGELKFLDQNVSSSRKQSRNFGPKILGTYPEYQFSNKRNDIELNQKPVGSMDLYANETIPAMHLLSLMDAGLRSSSPMDVNSEFLKRTSAYDQDPKDFYRPDSGASKIPNAKKHTSLDPFNTNQLAESSRRGVPVIPTVVGPSFYQQDKCFNKAIDFTQEKDKGKGIELREQNKGHKSQKSKSPVDNSGNTYCGSFPAHSMPAILIGGSDSVLFPLQNFGVGNSSKNNLETPSATRPGRPPKSNSETLICSVNRNPADFSAPDARNSYMISGKDLKFRRPAAPLPNGYTSPRLNVQKRQKKISSAKEAQRNGKNVCIS